MVEKGYSHEDLTPVDNQNKGSVSYSFDELTADQPVKERGFLGDAASHLARGTVNLIDTTAHAVDTLTPGGSKLAQNASDYLATLPQKVSILRPDESEAAGSEGMVKKGFNTALESAPQSLAIMPAAIVGAKAGGAIGSLVGPAGTAIGATAGGLLGGGAAMLGLFGAGQYGQRKKEVTDRLKIERPDLGEEQINDIAHENAMTHAKAEVLGESAGDLAGYLIFSKLPGGNAMYKGGKAILQELANPGAIKAISKGLLKDMPFEVGSEVGTSYFQNEADVKAGIADQTTKQAMIDSVIPAMFLSTGMGVAVGGYAAHQRNQAYKSLNDGPPEQRAQAVNAITGTLTESTDENIATRWRDAAMSYVQAGKEIPLDPNVADLAAFKPDQPGEPSETAKPTQQTSEAKGPMTRAVASLSAMATAPVDNLAYGDLVGPMNDRQMAEEWTMQEGRARSYLQTKNRQPGRETTLPPVPGQEPMTPAQQQRAADIAKFNESYNAQGTVPPSEGNITAEDAARFEQKVQRERMLQRKRDMTKQFVEREVEASKALQDLTIPQEVKTAATKQAREIASSDPVYSHMEEAKKRGGLNLKEFGQDYDTATISMINRRYPGIFSQKGTVRPDEFAGEMGYQNLDEMVQRFAEARTKKEIVGQIIKEKHAEWKDAERGQQEYFSNMADRKSFPATVGVKDGYVTPPPRTQYPASEEEISQSENLIRSFPDKFGEDYIDHWTYTADQQTRLRKALSEARSVTNEQAVNNAEIPGQLQGQGEGAGYPQGVGGVDGAQEAGGSVPGLPGRNKTQAEGGIDEIQNRADRNQGVQLEERGTSGNRLGTGTVRASNGQRGGSVIENTERPPGVFLSDNNRRSVIGTALPGGASNGQRGGNVPDESADSRSEVSGTRSEISGTISEKSRAPQLRGEINGQGGIDGQRELPSDTGAGDGQQKTTVVGDYANGSTADKQSPEQRVMGEGAYTSISNMDKRPRQGVAGNALPSDQSQAIADGGDTNVATMNDKQAIPALNAADKTEEAQSTPKTNLKADLPSAETVTESSTGASSQSTVAQPATPQPTSTQGETNGEAERQGRREGLLTKKGGGADSSPPVLDKKQTGAILVSGGGAKYEKTVSATAGAVSGGSEGRGSGISIFVNKSKEDRRDSLANSVVHQTIGTFEWGNINIDDARKAASLVFPVLAKSPQERVFVIATDDKGSPIAVLDHTKGKKNSSQVEPDTLLGFVHNTDGATRMWLVHNHPSGNPNLSSDDIFLSARIAELSKDTGVAFSGIVAVTPDGKFSGEYAGDHDAGTVKTGVNTDRTVALVDRVFDKFGQGERITNPEEAASFIKKNLQGKDGLILLNNNRNILGFVDLSVEEFRRMRAGTKGQGISKVLQAVESSNATSAIISTSSDIQGIFYENVAKALKAHGIYLNDTFYNGGNLNLSNKNTQDLPFYSKEESRQIVKQNRADIPSELTVAIRNGGDVKLSQDIFDKLEREGFKLDEKSWDDIDELTDATAGAFDAIPWRLPNSIVGRDRKGRVNQGGTPRSDFELAERLSGIFNKRIVWTTFDGNAEINGLIVRDRPSLQNRIFINPLSRNPAHVILGHELSHWLEVEHPEIYRDLYDAVSPLIKDVPAYRNQRQHLRQSSDYDVSGEIIGDLMGDAFADQNFWSQVAEQAGGKKFKSIAKKVMQWINSIINRLAGLVGYNSSQLVRDLHKTKIALARAVARYAEAQPKNTNVREGIRKSINPVFKQVNVNSDNFKRWFAGSKIKANGKPSVLYHGTMHPKFLKDKSYPWVFDMGRERNKVSSDFAGLGIFLGTQDAANSYMPFGEQAHPFYVRMEKPFVTTAADLEAKLKGSSAGVVRKRLQDLGGYDGIIIKDRGHAVVFDPNQVKSAQDNTGEFSRSNNDVRYSKKDLSSEQLEERRRILGEEHARIVDRIANEGLKAASEEQYFKTMLGEGEGTVRTEDAGLKTKARDWFTSLPKATARKALGALTLRQLRDVFAARIPQMGNFYQATREIAAGANKIMTKADEVYNQWMKLDKANAKTMSELMIKATVSGVNPDAEQYEPRANLKVLQDNIDRNLQSIIDLGKEMRTASDKDKVGIEEKQHRLREKIKKHSARMENEVQRYNAYKELSPVYQRMSKDAKDVYQAVKQMYTDNLNDLFSALEERINRQIKDPKAKKATMDAIRLKYDSYIAEGPYFPLSRFGDYIAIAEESGSGRREVRTFDSMAERTRYTRERRRAGWNVQEKTAREFNRETAGASSHFVEQLFDIIENKTDLSAEEKNPLKDEINQLFIKSMPDLSHRKHFAHRQKVEGYSRDQMRAFADNMQHAAHHIARIRHADKMEIAVKSILDESKMLKDDDNGDDFTDLYNELNARIKIMNDPDIPPVTSALTAFGFVMNIGPSIASAMVNMSQTPLVAYPMLATRFKQTGAITAFKEFTRASADYFTSKPKAETGPSLLDNPKIKQAEKDMIKALIDDGTIDVTQAHSLAQAAGSDFLNLARTKYGHVGLRAMRLISYPFHIAELANRKVTALAAYRLAIKNGMSHAEAVAEAREIVLESHFDYSAQNRARWMEGKVNRVLLLFKQYSQQMTWLLGRSFWQAAKGETPEVKNMARKRLAMILGGHFALAGMNGLPVLGGVIGTLEFIAAALGDDDEPKDFETAIKNFMADNFGKNAAEAAWSGPWRSIPGLGELDMSSRVSLGDLWFRAPEKEAEGKDKFNQYVNLILGPVATNASNVFMGLNSMAEGETWRGVEMMLPKAIKDGMKAVRYSREGVKNWNGDTLREDLSAMELIGQSIGFSSSSTAEMYSGANAIKNYEHNINRRRQILMNRYVQSVRNGDSDAAEKAMDNITAFNSKNPEFGITRQQLVQSYKQRQRVSAQTKDGAYLPATKEAIRSLGRFANI